MTYNTDYFLKYDLMSLPQHLGQFFKVKGLEVEYIGPKQKKTPFLFNRIIKSSQPYYTFRIKIIKTQSRNITIGIAGIFQGKIDFYRLEDEKKIAEEFKEGDVMQVEVNREGKNIMYFLNGVLKETWTNEELFSDGRVLLPYVQLCSQNDVVGWLIDSRYK